MGHELLQLLVIGDRKMVVFQREQHVDLLDSTLPQATHGGCSLTHHDPELYNLMAVQCLGQVSISTFVDLPPKKLKKVPLLLE